MSRHLVRRTSENSLRHRNFDALAIDLDNNIVALARRGILVVNAVPSFDVVGPLGFNPASVNAEAVLGCVADECRVVHDLAVKRQHGGQAFDLHLIERATRSGKRLFAGSAGNDQLCNHRIERAADDVARLDTGVYANSGAARGLEQLDRAGRWHKVAAGILAINSEFEAVTLDHRVCVIEHAALGKSELLAH